MTADAMVTMVSGVTGARFMKTSDVISDVTFDVQCIPAEEKRAR